MLIPIISLFVTHLLLPAYFLYILWRGKEKSQLPWLLKALYSGAFIGYIFLIGNWAWINYYLRFALLVLYVVTVIASFRRVSGAPFFVRDGRWWWVGVGAPLLLFLFFASFLVYAISGYFYTAEPVRLAFPLQEGRYYVGQGGNNPILNYHNPNRAQRYALDILQVNTLGVRAGGLYPTTPERYVIFGATVHSPCDGKVVTAVDGLPDHNPPATDTVNLAGNHVVIECQSIEVALAHLQSGSVAVGAGDTVTTGQPVGLVGNSGNTSEPHLHIHAVRAGSGTILEGEGVPLLFEERFPVRNTLLEQS